MSIYTSVLLYSAQEKYTLTFLNDRSSGLTAKFAKIQTAYGINWKTVTWSDMRQVNKLALNKSFKIQILEICVCVSIIIYYYECPLLFCPFE